MVLIARPILQEGVHGYCGRWSEDALVQLVLEWLGPSKEARKDVVVLAPLHATWRFDSWPGLRGLLDLLRAERIPGTALESKSNMFSYIVLAIVIRALSHMIQYHHANKRLTPYAGSSDLECGVIFQTFLKQHEHEHEHEHGHERSAIHSCHWESVKLFLNLMVFCAYV